MNKEEPQVLTRWQDPTIEQLQQENKQLKAELELYKDNEEYLNNKIDNAIEYIKECEYHLVIQPQKLLEILGDKENE